MGASNRICRHLRATFCFRGGYGEWMCDSGATRFSRQQVFIEWQVMEEGWLVSHVKIWLSAVEKRQRPWNCLPFFDPSSPHDGILGIWDKLVLFQPPTATINSMFDSMFYSMYEIAVPFYFIAFIILKVVGDIVSPYRVPTVVLPANSHFWLWSSAEYKWKSMSRSNSICPDSIIFDKVKCPFQINEAVDKVPSLSYCFLCN